mmetsp:Transcript_30050/g.66099  ORF Transcript_30050/g.66099 Transcript_30050/m.66099 type:complete len:189 (+) Transcript_30050:127-693(+)
MNTISATTGSTPRLGGQRRAAHDDIELSEECVADNYALTEDRDLVQAVNDLMSTCTGEVIHGQKIQWDFRSCNTTAAADACAAAGGRRYTHDVFFSCSGRGQSLTVDLNGVPDCYGASCEAETIEAKNASNFQHMFTDLNAAGYTCGQGIGFWDAEDDASGGASIVVRGSRIGTYCWTAVLLLLLIRR